MLPLSPQTHQQLATYIHGLCGILLGPEKTYLIEQRLGGLLPRLGCPDYEALARLLHSPSGQTPPVRNTILSAITTNETSFFRDGAPFAMFASELLPPLLRQAPAPIRIWSAACSSGQEPYSIAITILEALRTSPRPSIQPGQVRILATDISPQALARAAQGSYAGIDITRGLTTELRDRYFTPTDNGQWTVARSLREMIEFRPINLMEDFTRLGYFHVIFCRNVLIYFSEENKKRILRQMHGMLPGHGSLLLGSAENMYNLNSGFESVHTPLGMYYKA